MYNEDRSKKIILIVLALLVTLLLSMDLKKFNAMTPEEYAESFIFSTTGDAFDDWNSSKLVALYFTDSIASYENPDGPGMTSGIRHFFGVNSLGYGVTFSVPLWSYPSEMNPLGQPVRLGPTEYHATTQPSDGNILTPEELEAYDFINGAYNRLEVNKNEKQNFKALAFLFSGLLVFASFFFVIVKTFTR